MINLKNLIAGGGIVIGLFVQLFARNSLAGQGDALVALESEIREVGRQNKILHEELAKATSIKKLSSSVGELGLVLPERVVYMDLSTPLASVAQ